MISALVEGIAQSLLPCSWTLLLPAVTLGLATRRVAVLGTFAVAAVLTAWIAVAGWVIPPLWLAGVALLVGGLLWWRLGPGSGAAAMIGVGSAWAWQPCVGPELGEALTTAQSDPWSAFGGLAMFLLGVVGVGLGIGVAGGFLLDRLGKEPLTKAGAFVVAVLGLTMVVGLYPKIASTLAQWSTALWG